MFFFTLNKYIYCSCNRNTQCVKMLVGVLKWGDGDHEKQPLWQNFTSYKSIACLKL